MSDDELIARLEDCTLSPDNFHHTDHLHAAWIYFSRFPALEAMRRFSAALRAFATSLGQPDRYHETITWGYLLLLNERIHRAPQTPDWNSFAALHPDLFDWNESILRKYYRKETLESAHARAVFVMPDL
jgi:hypothetical protein